MAALGLGASSVAGGLAATSLPTEAAAHASTQLPATTITDDRILPADGASPGPTVTVEANTTAWKLAETHLDEGSRWKEILDLNRGTRLGDGTVFTQGTQTIPPGSTLRLPAGVRPGPAATSHRKQAPAGNYTVKPGDTLWDISEVRLEDPTRTWRSTASPPTSSSPARPS